MLSGNFDPKATEYVQDGMAMKNLYVDAIKERKQRDVQQGKQPEQEKNLENQAKVPDKRVPMA